MFRHEMMTLRSNTPPSVPMTGSQDGVGMDNMMIPMNCESVTVTPSPPQASLNLWSSAMCPGNVSVFPSKNHLACRHACARFWAIGSACAYLLTRLSQAVLELEQSRLA